MAVFYKDAGIWGIDNPVVSLAICHCTLIQRAEMRNPLPVVGLLLTLGCFGESISIQIADPPSDANDGGQSRYVVLTDPPDALLDRMASEYPFDNREFRRRWTEEASAAPLDSKRVIELLEIACYADVTCHRVEYPLRVATLEHIAANSHAADVRDALHWIQASYQSGLPIDSPGDTAGHFRGVLVQSMRLRMDEYAGELLRPKREREAEKPTSMLQSRRVRLAD